MVSETPPDQIARHEIFTVENREKWRPDARDDEMFQALVKGKQELVQFFMDDGVQLNHFLTIKQLHKLYHASIKEEEKEKNTMSIIFKTLRQNADFSIRCCRVGDDNCDPYLLRDVGKVINNLLNDEYNHMYMEERFIVRLKDDEQSRLSTTKTSDFENPERELFIWALLFNKVELAELLWKMCTDPIGGALVACSLLKSLAKEAAHQEEIDISESLKRQADGFEKKACGVLKSCYEHNKDEKKDYAHRLLTRELDNWGKRTLFALAESAQLMDFMQLGCCQTKLNAIWFGRMADYTKKYKIIAALVCPLFIGLIHFKSDNTEIDEFNRYDDSLDTWFCQKTHCTEIGGIIGLIQKLWDFYTSPVAKFYLSMGFYIIYLCLFTFVVSTMEVITFDEEFTTHSLMEAILWGWALCFFLEEMRQLASREAGFYNIVIHIKSFWNILDLVIFLLFIYAIGLRLLHAGPENHTLRKLYAVALLLSYVRFMENFYAWKTTGTKIIMIERMLKDLIIIICIFVVFIFGFGFAMQLLLYPNMQFTYWSVINALYLPFSQVFGELSIDTSDGTTHCTTTNMTEYDHDIDVQMCPEQTWTVRLLFAVYMMLTNVILMNMLTVMFGSTLKKVEDIEKVWRLHSYSIVYDYFDAPALPAPFMLFVLIKRLAFYIYRRCCSHTFYGNAGFKMRLSVEENKRLSNFEESERECYLAELKKMISEQMDNRLKETRFQKMEEDIQYIKEVVGKNETLYLETDQRATSSRGIATDHNRITVRAPDRIDRQTELIQELIKALTKANPAPS